MAELEYEVKVSEAPTRNHFEHLPPGDYVCIMTRFAESTKVGEELVRTLEHDVQDGDFSGRKIFDRLNFGADAQWKIDNCYAAIAEIAKAVGVDTVKKDMSNIMNKRFVARVGVTKPKTEGGKVFNNISEYLPYGSSASGGASTPKPVAKTTETVKSNSVVPPTDQNSLPPWKRQKS